MKRYDFTVEKKRLIKRGKLLMPTTTITQKHVYADSEEDAIKQLKMKGYKVVENETSI